MTDFELKKHEDGSFALLNDKEELIDGRFVKDTGGPISVWATARTDEGQAFYVKLPVTRLLLEHDPKSIEDRLHAFAEHWERGFKARAENVNAQTVV